MVFMSPVHTEKMMPPIPRKSYARLPRILDVPSLIKVQLESFRWFQEEGLRQRLQEISPIKDFTGNRPARRVFISPLKRMLPVAVNCALLS